MPLSAPSHPRQVDVGQRTLSFSDFGQGEPVLMLHGGGPGATGLSNYSRNIDALARGFRLIVPDMPGYGQSSKGHLDPADPFGDLADAMFGLLDALDIPRAHVVGNSLGGACALRMALERPDRIGALILMGPGGIDLARTGPTPGLLRMLSYYDGEGPTRDKLTAFIRGDLVYDGAAVPDALIEERFLASSDPQTVANPPLRRPQGPNPKLDLCLDPRLDTLAVPCLALWGVEDRVNPAAGAQTLQQRMPSCDAYVFSRTGHWVQWERAAEFNAAATAFLQRTSLGAAQA